MKNKTYRLEPGEAATLNEHPIVLDDPVIERIGGPRPYIWIGNGTRSTHGQWCYGTISERKLLKLLGIEFPKVKRRGQ